MLENDRERIILPARTSSTPLKRSAIDRSRDQTPALLNFYFNDIIDMSIERTVIGSFPRQLSTDSFIKAIKDVVDLQLEYGIEIITDGEQRYNMIQYFEQIPGLERKNGSLKISWKSYQADWWDDSVEIYARFKGTENYKPIRSANYRIRVV